MLPFASCEIKDVVSPSLKPRQYDSPFFIELAYPRDTAEQYLVSATHVHLKMSLSVTHPLHTARPKTALLHKLLLRFCSSSAHP